jgi:Ca2+-binding RTX toxin-like protein
MSNQSPLNAPRGARPVRPALLAAALAGAVAAAAAVTAAPADAAPQTGASSSQRHGAAHAPRPKLRHGTLTVRGTRASDLIAVRLQAGRPDRLQVDFGDDGSAEFTFRRDRVAKLVVNARAGADAVRIDETNGIFTDTIPTTIDGGDGNDTLAGGSGAEQLRGGRGDDVIDGNKGNDVAFMGAGDDTFVWDPGDGSDVVEGQDGSDTMRFNGAGIAERFDLSANGNRLRFFRDIGTITMDTDGVETVDVNALGGADTVTVNDLSGTDVTRVVADLAGTLGGSTGDGQQDGVIVHGTAGSDVIATAGANGTAQVVGLAATVDVTHAEPANDTLTVSADAGDDAVVATALEASAIRYAATGGTGDDVLIGGHGDDALAGGDGDDVLIGGPGVDTLDGGAGSNTLLQD